MGYEVIDALYGDFYDDMCKNTIETQTDYSQMNLSITEHYDDMINIEENSYTRSTNENKELNQYKLELEQQVHDLLIKNEEIKGSYENKITDIFAQVKSLEVTNKMLQQEIASKNDEKNKRINNAKMINDIQNQLTEQTGLIQEYEQSREILSREVKQLKEELEEKQNIIMNLNLKLTKQDEMLKGYNINQILNPEVYIYFYLIL